jgi:hypothetical protein
VAPNTSYFYSDWKLVWDFPAPASGKLKLESIDKELYYYTSNLIHKFKYSL